MTRRGHLNIPVIGVARGDWTVEQFRARARESITAHGGLDPDAFDRLAARLCYVAGDYQDAATFDRLRRALGLLERPLFHLAIPPSLFATVASGLARSGCAAQARVIVEKPFGRDLASAKALNTTMHGSFSERAVYRIDHTSTACRSTRSIRPGAGQDVGEADRSRTDKPWRTGAGAS